MKIEHVAIWVKDLEKSRAFYEQFFEAISNEKYENPKKRFSSYFLSFRSGARLELMNKESISLEKSKPESEWIGLAHFAVSVGSKAKVDELTDKIRNSGFQVIGEPRITGDGYYESVVLDVDNNRIEITI